MAMTTASGPDEPLMEINTTPLIDVMLVLLITFITAVPIMTHSVGLNVAKGGSPPAPLPVIGVEIDFDGTLVVNGQTVPDFDRLEAYLQTAARMSPQPEVHVRPDLRTHYDHVARVLAIAQRSGIERIGFAGNERLLQ